MANTWILVAESSRAKLYEFASRSEPLVELEDRIHPFGRMHEGDLVSDKEGSDGGSVGQGRHILDNRTSAKDHEDLVFARELADVLEAAHHNGSFKRLILIAPPAFLGLLRNSLSKIISDCVATQIDKNLVQHSEEEIRNHL